jgi:hypothetical protein
MPVVIELSCHCFCLVSVSGDVPDGVGKNNKKQVVVVHWQENDFYKAFAVCLRIIWSAGISRYKRASTTTGTGVSW